MGTVKPELEFPTTHEALTYLNAIKKEDDSLIFRGEAASYPHSQPSLARYSSEIEIRENMRSINSFAARHCLEVRLNHHLNYNANIPLYKSEFFGCVDLNGWHEQEGTIRNTDVSLIGIQQHTGIPTELLDFSSLPQVAVQFANQNNHSDYGYIYFCRRADLMYVGRVIDIGYFANQLTDMIGLPNSRLTAQAGIMLQNPSLICVREYCRSISFKKSDLSSKENIDLFPMDGLNHWVRGYFVDYYYNISKQIAELDSPNKASRSFSDTLNSLIDHLDLLH